MISLRMPRALMPLLALLASLGAALGQPAPNQPDAPQTAGLQVATPALPPHFRADLYPQWIDAQGKVSWPPNNGFDAAPYEQTLDPGSRIDRFGSEGGSFFSPKGELFAARALPYVCSQMPYTVYVIKQPVVVMAGKAAPWFGEPGGGVQYQTSEPAYKLREAGKLEVANDNSPNGKSAAPCGGP
jgi:hypothetical protein